MINFTVNNLVNSFDDFQSSLFFEEIVLIDISRLDLELLFAYGLALGEPPGKVD